MSRHSALSCLALIALAVSAGSSFRDATADAPIMTLEDDLKLEPGRFAAFPGTALGEPTMFQNDIDATSCFPLIAITGSSRGATLKFTGPVLLWLHRAHRVGTRVFLEPCDLWSPLASPPGTVEGAINYWWFEGRLVDAAVSPRVELRRLALQGWGMFSNPAFCGHSIAYWSLGEAADARGAELIAMVADVLDGRVLASRSFGRVRLETDNRWCFRPATWGAGCRAATFDASAQGKIAVRLEIPR